MHSQSCHIFYSCFNSITNHSTACLKHNQVINRETVKTVKDFRAGTITQINNNAEMCPCHNVTLSLSLPNRQRIDRPWAWYMDVFCKLTNSGLVAITLTDVNPLPIIRSGIKNRQWSLCRKTRNFYTKICFPKSTTYLWNYRLIIDSGELVQR